MPNSVTTTSSSTPWAAPYLQNLWNGAFGLANRPYQQYQGPQVAGLSDLQTGALGGINGAMFGNPTTWSGMNALQGIINGGGNPNLNGVVDTTVSDANRAFGSQLGQLNETFSNPNSWGSDRHALGAGTLTQDFGRGLGQSIGNLRYGAYNDGLNRQMTAAGQAQSMTNSSLQNMLAGLQAGQIPQQLQQRIYDQGQTNFNNWWQYPQQQSQFLGGLMGLGGNSQNSTTTSPGPNSASQWLGGASLALGGLNASGAFGNNGWMTGSNGWFG